jgi:hypothetical protein
MALRTLVICPDCVGNRGHCVDAVNCLRPQYRLQELVAAVVRSRALSEPARAAMLQAASATVAGHSLERERMQVIGIFEALS